MGYPIASVAWEKHNLYWSTSIVDIKTIRQSFGSMLQVKRVETTILGFTGIMQRLIKYHAWLLGDYSHIGRLFDIAGKLDSKGYFSVAQPSKAQKVVEAVRLSLQVLRGGKDSRLHNYIVFACEKWKGLRKEVFFIIFNSILVCRIYLWRGSGKRCGLNRRLKLEVGVAGTI